MELTTIQGYKITLNKEDILLYRGGSEYTYIELKDGTELYVKESFDYIDNVFDLLTDVDLLKKIREKQNK